MKVICNVDICVGTNTSKIKIKVYWKIEKNIEEVSSHEEFVIHNFKVDTSQSQDIPQPTLVIFYEQTEIRLHIFITRASSASK